MDTPADWLLFALILAATAASYIYVVWLLRKAAEWMLFPGPEPDPDDELGVATHRLQVELNAVLRPPLERLVIWLGRHLPKAP